MYFKSPLTTVAYALGIAAVACRAAIMQSVYDDLIFYFQYASSAYDIVCARPNGNTMIASIFNAVTDTQGFIVRDDTRREIVVALRGSTSPVDFLVDSQIALVPIDIPGVNAPSGTKVHFGFQTAWNSVASEVISTVKNELDAHPGYGIVTTGHSLGGALSSLAGITMQQNFPSMSVRMYTYGQPRVGNTLYALFVDFSLSFNIFRVVHTDDGVPTIIPPVLGYRHHVFEYFQNPDPPSAATTRICDATGEDPTCSDSIPSGGINLAHPVYFGIVATTPFCS
ncbi:alpha/beta-hydrolase [Amylostereum chailletii]|nr:alpha/beta-hydrolase [Amylostereum chailletii]